MSASSVSMERSGAASAPVAVVDNSANGGESGVSWAAIFAGAAGAAALSLVLMILGFGLGLSSVSPWSEASASAAAIGIGTIAWITFTQLAASGLGGYLAGRLRVKWVRVHTDEVYFRDTAHGFLAWAVASLVTAAFLTSAVTTALGTGVKATSTVAAGVSTGVGLGGTGMATHEMQEHGNAGGSSTDYFVDALFRGSAASTTTDGNSTSASSSTPGNAMNNRHEAAGIFAHDLQSGELSAEDKAYLGQVVARQTGMSQEESEVRVNDKFNRAKTAIATATNDAKQTADQARKSAAYSALWMFVALMCGAFFASWMATYGGARRDHIVI